MGLTLDAPANTSHLRSDGHGFSVVGAFAKTLDSPLQLLDRVIFEQQQQLYRIVKFQLIEYGFECQQRVVFLLVKFDGLVFEQQYRIKCQ